MKVQQRYDDWGAIMTEHANRAAKKKRRQKMMVWSAITVAGLIIAWPILLGIYFGASMIAGVNATYKR